MAGKLLRKLIDIQNFGDVSALQAQLKANHVDSIFHVHEDFFRVFVRNSDLPAARTVVALRAFKEGQKIQQEQRQ